MFKKKYVVDITDLPSKLSREIYDNSEAGQNSYEKIDYDSDELYPLFVSWLKENHPSIKEVLVLIWW